MVLLPPGDSETRARGIVFHFAPWILNKLRFNFADLPGADALQVLIYPVTKLISAWRLFPHVLRLPVQLLIKSNRSNSVGQSGNWHAVVLVKINLGNTLKRNPQKFSPNGHSGCQMKSVSN